MTVVVLLEAGHEKTPRADIAEARLFWKDYVRRAQDEAIDRLPG